MNKIILDTDPGIDDAVAIILLLKECSERVEAIVTSYGNISIENTTQNALAMLSLLDLDIPVIKGCEKPDNALYADASYIHGVDGLGGLQVESSDKKAIEGDYLKLIYDRIIKAGKVDYIALGPLTNLALLMKRFPDVLLHIDSIVCMGGGINMGNITEFAEFNIHCDAKSAEFVFANAKKLALVTLNTTTNVHFNLEQIALIGERDGIHSKAGIGRALENILTANYYSCIKHGENGSVMHDSTAVLYYLFPKFFKTKKCGISVACDEHYGETVILNDRDNITLTLSTDVSKCRKKIMESV